MSQQYGMRLTNEAKILKGYGAKPIGIDLGKSGEMEQCLGIEHILEAFGAQEAIMGYRNTGIPNHLLYREHEDGSSLFVLPRKDMLERRIANITSHANRPGFSHLKGKDPKDIIAKGYTEELYFLEAPTRETLIMHYGGDPEDTTGRSEGAIELADDYIRRNPDILKPRDVRAAWSNAELGIHAKGESKAMIDQLYEAMKEGQLIFLPNAPETAKAEFLASFGGGLALIDGRTIQ